MGFANRLEGGPHLCCEQRGPLPGGEASVLLEFVVIDKLGMGLLAKLR
jgi:hypothetical protein